MKYNIVFTDDFNRQFKELKKKYASARNDLAVLLAELQQHPQSGESLGRSCYKVRVKIKSKNAGKRDGARAITCVKLVGEVIYLLAIYDKSDQATLSDKEIDAILSSAGIN
ncbi:hypothetical protein A0257_06030 [Hymenobacter psoromatis]|nr:hypothetical protein A0257_06030 [Hymenobacter psoromatis]